MTVTVELDEQTAADHGDKAQSVLREFSAAEERFAKQFMTRQLRRN